MASERGIAVKPSGSGARVGEGRDEGRPSDTLLEGGSEPSGAPTAGDAGGERDDAGAAGPLIGAGVGRDEGRAAEPSETGARPEGSALVGARAAAELRTGMAAGDDGRALSGETTPGVVAMAAAASVERDGASIPGTVEGAAAGTARAAGAGVSVAGAVTMLEVLLEGAGRVDGATGTREPVAPLEGSATLRDGAAGAGALGRLCAASATLREGTTGARPPEVSPVASPREGRADAPPVEPEPLELCGSLGTPPRMGGPLDAPPDFDGRPCRVSSSSSAAAKSCARSFSGSLATARRPS